MSHGPSSGTVEIDAVTGEWSYMLSTNSTGTDQFTVTVTDDLGGTTTQNVNISVEEVDGSVTQDGIISFEGADWGV